MFNHKMPLRVIQIGKCVGVIFPKTLREFVGGIEKGTIVLISIEKKEEKIEEQPEINLTDWG